MKKCYQNPLKKLVVIALLLSNSFVFAQQSKIKQIVDDLAIINKSTYENSYMCGFEKTAFNNMEKFQKEGLIICFYFKGNGKVDFVSTTQLEPFGLPYLRFENVWVNGWKSFYFGGSYIVEKAKSASGTGFLYRIYPRENFYEN